MMLYERYGKRALDIALSASALLVLAPVLLAIAAAIRLEDGGRVLFRQRRVGRNGEPFQILKFRSMPEATGDVPSHAAHTLRITRVGRFIRRTNLDELPQLINILRGDMSVVGPRPALLSQEDLVALRRGSGAIACTPGLTGLAQVNAYDGMPVTVKAEWDGRYAQRVSLLGDARIIIRTVKYVMNPPPVY